MKSAPNLAIFDLDNTLLAGDSDHLWGEFLIEQGQVDGQWYARENQRYYEAYTAGTLDIREFLRFSLQPLRDNDPAVLEEWRAQFLTDKIEPIIPAASRKLLQLHKARGDELLIITATNHFITEPIATLLGVPNLLATDLEIIDGRYTGEIAGIPCFQHGKVERLRLWQNQHNTSYASDWFYSDSHNDLPLLEQVAHPVAVDPDTVLHEHAKSRGWPVVSLRQGSGNAIFERTCR